MSYFDGRLRFLLTTLIQFQDPDKFLEHFETPRSPRAPLTSN